MQTKFYKLHIFKNNFSYKKIQKIENWLLTKNNNVNKTNQ